MTNIEAEFALRSIAIEALAICSEVGFELASITVIPSDGTDDDYWKTTYQTDNETVIVSTSYGEEVDDGGDDAAAAQEAGDRAWRP